MTEGVFVSTFMYAACKVATPAVWHAPSADVVRSLKWELARMSESAWDGFRTIDQLLRFSDADVYVDASTYIDRARCVAAKHFLASARDVWVSVDDDVFAEEDVLARLVGACRVTRRGIAVPYLHRDDWRMTYQTVRAPTYHRGAFALRTVDRVGLGLVALHRVYVEALARCVPLFREKSMPGEPPTVPRLFTNGELDGGTWLGEDYAFCKLAEDEGMPMAVLLDAPASHVGKRAKLDLDGQVCIPPPLAG